MRYLKHISAIILLLLWPAMAISQSEYLDTKDNAVGISLYKSFADDKISSVGVALSAISRGQSDFGVSISRTSVGSEGITDFGFFFDAHARAPKDQTGALIPGVGASMSTTTDFNGKATFGISAFLIACPNLNAPTRVQSVFGISFIDPPLGSWKTAYSISFPIRFLLHGGRVIAAGPAVSFMDNIHVYTMELTFVGVNKKESAPSQ